MYQLGCENLCFFLSERRLKGGVGVFPWEASGRQDRGFFTSKSTLFKTRERRHRIWQLSASKRPEITRSCPKLPPAGQVAVPESEGTAVPHAVAAGGLGLHHEGACPHLQGRHRQHQRRDPGAGDARLSRPGARPQRERAAWLHRVHHFGAAEGAGTDARAYPGKTYTGKSNTGEANVGCPNSGEPRPIKY